MTVEETTALEAREEQREERREEQQERKERRRIRTLLAVAVAALLGLALGLFIGGLFGITFASSPKYSATVHINSLASSVHSSPTPYHFSVSIHNNQGARTLEHPYIVLDYNDAIDVGTHHRFAPWQNAYSFPGPVKAGATVTIPVSLTTDYPGPARIQVLVFGDRSHLGSYAGKGTWAGAVSP